MKKLNLLFTALLLMCCVGTAKAVEVKINGIGYYVNTDTKQAMVISWFTKYSGDIVIPSKITYNNVTCSVTSIRQEAFEDCSGLTSITIPNSVTGLGDAAFCGCSGLTSVTIGNSVTGIRDAAFKGCSGLTSIEIPNSVTSIGQEAFDGCSGLTSITIPNSVTSIENSAFDGCSGLTSITIPNSVTSIGYYAFSRCSGLTSITIPNSVTSIDTYAFWGCSGLESIVVDPRNTKYDSRDNCNAIIETATNTLVLGCKNTIIPNSVTSIGNSAFYNCTGLTSITIPNSVTSIGDNAFRYCSGLTSITIPNSVTSIGHSAFYNCTGLTSITIPNSVTSIDGYAFEGCSNLTDVYCLATNVPATSSNAFNSSYTKNMKLHVPAEARYSYRTTEPWSEFGTIVALDDETIQEINLTTEAGLPGYISSPHDHAVINPTSPWDQGGVAAMIDDDVNTHFHTAWENVPTGPHYFEIDMGKGNTIGKFCFDYVTRNDCSNDWAREFTIKGSNNGTDFELITVVDFGTNAKYGSSHSSEVLGSNDKTYRYLRFEVTNTNSMEGAGFRTYFHIAEFDLFAINERDCSADDNTDIINIPAKAVFVTSNNGTINISCSLEGENVAVYSSNAMYIGSTTIENGTATIESGLSKGDIAIIKIAEKSIKVILN